MDFTDKGMWPLVYPQITCLALAIFFLLAFTFGLGLLTGLMLRW